MVGDGDVYGMFSFVGRRLKIVGPALKPARTPVQKRGHSSVLGPGRGREEQ